ncbi:MAG: DJ-1/PfpI family protein [Alphaproteobacteria bacterium]
MNAGAVLAVLAAGGLHENDLMETQKAVRKTGIKLKIVSMDQGLLSSWNAQGWGLSFAVDTILNQALAADYAALLIPGGKRSINKLKLTAHTKRFISGFIDNGKPVIAIDEGVDLLAFSEKITGRVVSAPESLKATLETAGAEVTDTGIEQDANLMTVATARGPDLALAPAIADFLNANFTLKKAA